MKLPRWLRNLGLAIREFARLAHAENDGEAAAVLTVLEDDTRTFDGLFPSTYDPQADAEVMKLPGDRTLTWVTGVDGCHFVFEDCDGQILIPRGRLYDRCRKLWIRLSAQKPVLDHEEVEA